MDDATLLSCSAFGEALIAPCEGVDMDDVRKMLRNLSDAANQRGAPLDWFEDLYEVADKDRDDHCQKVNLIHSSSIGWANHSEQNTGNACR